MVKLYCRIINSQLVVVIAKFEDLQSVTSFNELSPTHALFLCLKGSSIATDLKRPSLNVNLIFESKTSEIVTLDIKRITFYKAMHIKYIIWVVGIVPVITLACTYAITKSEGNFEETVPFISSSIDYVPGKDGDLLKIKKIFVVDHLR